MPLLRHHAAREIRRGQRRRQRQLAHGGARLSAPAPLGCCSEAFRGAQKLPRPRELRAFFSEKCAQSGVWIGKQASAHNAPLRRMADYSRTGQVLGYKIRLYRF